MPTESCQTAERVVNADGSIDFTEELRDSEINDLMQRREEHTTFYVSGEVDIIEQKLFGPSLDILICRNIKHYLDGKKPEVTIIQA